MVGCTKPPGNASGDGLGRFCKAHLEHYRRHGDPLKGSYKAAQLAPHRKAAAAWIKENRTDPFAVAALGAVESLMLSAGKVIEPQNLRGVPTKDRARSIWARIRDRGRKPEEALAAILSVAICYAADYQRAKPEHRTVQIAKVLNRLGGGRVKRWPVHDPSAPNRTITLRWFPASEGLVLREIGEQAERAAEFLIHDRMEQLIEYSAQYRQRLALTALPFTEQSSKV